MAPKKAIAKKVEEPKKVEAEAKKAEEPKKADKRKAEAVEEPAKKEEPTKKEAKKVEDETASKAAVKEVEEEKGEKEKDFKEDNRPNMKDTVGWDNADTTINVVPTTGGQVLMSLTEGGMQFLLAGARANVGVKSGRYMYEVKIIEALPPTDNSHSKKVPLPRQLLRLGFSTTDSPLLLSPGAAATESVFFDSEGFFTTKDKRVPTQRFTREQVLAVLLNVDSKSPNANTVSLFRNGVRICEPMPIPEDLHGKALYPHVTFRNVTLMMNFGPHSMKPLPFTCRMIQNAAKSDVTPARSSVPKDGKYEVMLPVAFPDEGTFEWLDDFLQKNPHYVELSDRKLIDWAVASGFWKAKSFNASNDKPEFNFGVQLMDDLSARRIMNAAAAAVPRNYVVMEVKGNLIEKDRAEVLKRFGQPHFKPVAQVVMGEPNEAFKKTVHEELLKEKQLKADAVWKQKKAEQEKRKAVMARQKQIEEMRKKKEEERKQAEDKKKAEAKEKKEAEDKAKNEAEAKKQSEAKEGETPENAGEGKDGEKKEEAKDGEKKEEDVPMPDAKKEEEAEGKKEEEKKEEEKKEAKKEEEEDLGEEPPQVELDDADKKNWFLKKASPDLSKMVLENSFGNFTIPEKTEGFADIKFEWQGHAQSKDYLRKWVLEKKLVSRMELLQPSQWFKDKAATFKTSIDEWQKKQKEFEAKKKEEKEKAEKKDGEEADEEDKMQVDIFSLEDICDIGKGEPLFANFSFDDWALLLLRHELHLLVHAFRKDANDPDRVGIHESTFMYYYSKYYRKTINPKAYGVEKEQDVTDLIKDCVTFNATNKVLASSFEEDLESPSIFAKLTEQCRRERQRRIDAGDETGRLKFNAQLLQQQANYVPSQPQIQRRQAPGIRHDKGGFGAHDKGGFGAPFGKGGSKGSGACNDFKQGRCTRGDSCRYAHV